LRLKLTTQGLVPVFTVALAFLAFGAAGMLSGSGFLATYVAAVLLGNARLPYRAGLLRVHDALAWFSQVSMFAVLGLLTTPRELWQVAPLGLALGLVLAVVARPIAVMACLLPFDYRWRERGFVSWVGLRGAVPIVLAIFPVLRGVPGAERIFDVVFFIVVVNAILPGATVRRAARLLRVQVSAPPPPRALIEISSTESLQGEIVAFYIEAASAVAGARIADLPLPEGATITLVSRGTELVAPRGATELRAGDHVHVFCRPEDKPLVLLLFGRTEEE
jgi:cell volume regulation protein A